MADQQLPGLPPAAEAEESKGRHPARAIRNYLIAGLLIWIPIVITVWVVRFISGILDQSLVLIPRPWRPETLFGTYIPGLGIILSLLLLLLTGLLVRHLFGERLVEAVERLVRRIPVIGSVYGGAKSFSETVLTDKGDSFKQVVMVEFPRQGMHSIGFVTSDQLKEAQAKTSRNVISVFVPTTPNPTTGFLVLVPRSEVIELDMSVDEAFKMLFTLGVVVPDWKKQPHAGNLAPQQTEP
jgi:uncharacterized membrane protein